MEFKWKTLSNENGKETSMMELPEGCIIRTIVYYGDSHSKSVAVHQVFVPRAC